MSDADALPPTPDGMKRYDEFLREIKGRIQSAQVRAALALSREVVLLHWQIGKEIRERQVQHGWGAAATPIGVAAFRVTDALPADLVGSLPTVEQIESELAPRTVLDDEEAVE